MFLITSAAYVTPALASEFGKLPPCMLPVQNKRLYEHQVALSRRDETIVLSLPASYQLTNFDRKRLDFLGVEIVYVPDGLSLGQSVIYVLNYVRKYNERLDILHGDTLFDKLPRETNVCAVATAEDGYDWDSVNHLEQHVYAGYFSFSDQSLLIQKITLNGYRFIDGIEDYSKDKDIRHIVLSEWLDFGLSNSYYRSISKLTTQRAFNSMKVTKYSVRKSSADRQKMVAEANWIHSIPIPMKHYVPTLWDSGEDENGGYYEIEYYYLSSLSNLFVFGKNKTYVLEEMIDACIEYLNDEAKYHPDNAELFAKQNDLLYEPKTIKRLEVYAHQSGISLEKKWIINGKRTPSLRTIVREMDAEIRKSDVRFATLMHGDPCFSNILYDFKSKTIKLIDPRGMDSSGNLSIYGDFRYDVGKLAHSVLGLYDYIIGGMFDYSENEEYNITFNIEIGNEVKHIQNYFSQKKFGGYTLSQLSTYPILVQLFLSMLPLHNDNTLRQKAMMANALKIYTDYKMNNLTQ